ncbi:Na+/H+ antiporter [Mucilaginibacter aquatilis]|uniref:Na+/H+ antiporter n=1 Tax=Mucilaginibacter aquatilis TaxID=1517760 RepID=A0A6I4I941_9SPHI|nr:Na+/H+ antiporter [Mucilaginibacter aquatilis]MVN91611.1 Na+/H+ antiporter [Mucilaginibacter aquatilis]
MHNTLLQFLLLLTVAFLLILLARRLKIAYPIFLVLAGLIISNIPGMPVINIEPDLVFLIFLPPLLYEAAWWTSWNEFWKWKRPISLLAFGLVFLTSSVVAYTVSSFIPGFTLATGFLLGGIISPPDAIAATSVLKSIRVPKRIITILEGESLVNDASSLTVFRFALATAIAGHFSFQDASVSFVTVTIMGIVIGLAVAHVIYLIHRFLPTTASIDSAFTLVAPYLMYLAAEEFHFSGVMAVVSGGLFLSYRSHEIFVDGQSRLQTLNVWSTISIILNGLVFIMIGLGLPGIVAGLEGYSLMQASVYGLLVSALVIAIRMAWIYPATFVPRWLFKSLRLKEPPPGWKGPFVIGWAGMRGVVSLAAALSLPLTVTDGQPLPERNLIIFITFVVILVTLVFQGLTLPWIIKLLNIQEVDVMIPIEQQEAEIRIRLTKAAIDRLEHDYKQDLANNTLLAALRDEYESNLNNTSQKLECMECAQNGKRELAVYRRVIKDIYKAQRKELYLLRKYKLFSDDAIRKEEMQIDISEMRVDTLQ